MRLRSVPVLTAPAAATSRTHPAPRACPRGADHNESPSRSSPDPCPAIPTTAQSDPANPASTADGYVDRLDPRLPPAQGLTQPVNITMRATYHRPIAAGNRRIQTPTT